MVLEKRDNDNPELIVPTMDFKLCNKLLIFIHSKLFGSQGKRFLLKGYIIYD
jgi:hypothetical protein